jgi:hypothetical protein
VGWTDPKYRALLTIYSRPGVLQPFTTVHPNKESKETIAEVFLPSAGSSDRALQHVPQITPVAKVNHSSGTDAITCSACSANDERQPVSRLDERIAFCSYHGPLLTLPAVHLKEQLLPLDQFLADGPGRQYAMFVVGDCGHMSTNKGCTCEGTGEELELSNKEDRLREDETGANESCCKDLSLQRKLFSRV